MFKLVIATRNSHKVGEIESILGDECTCLCLRDLPGVPELVEDGMTFAANATRKAVQLARWLAAAGLGQPGALVLADDSGLEVDALGGAPGVHSARYAALDSGVVGNSPDRENNAKLLAKLEGVAEADRTARFKCLLALTPVAECTPENASPVCAADEFELTTRLFEGTCEGRIAFAASGKGGFGYDPLFIPTGYHESFAELGEEIKNRISHRAKALEKLKTALKA